MRTPSLFVLLFLLITLASAKVYFKENFENGIDHWVTSNWKSAEGTDGKFEWSAGKFFKDQHRGLITTTDNRYYTASVKFDEFSNRDKTLVFQYSLKYDQNVDCGGAYVKYFPHGIDQKNMDCDTKYNIMFGPDICGSTERVHVILNYKDKNYLINKAIKPKRDHLTHLYTLILRHNNSYQVLIDGEEVSAGSLFEDWDILEPKLIPDPSVSKPDDWVDVVEIEDPTDVKPEGYDSIPESIPDPNASKPDDWDDESDGDWETPIIQNPEYKGPWKPRMIPNPDYKGPWVHPKIDNPNYKEIDDLYAYDSFGALGIEVWQVKSGSIFNDFLITDDVAIANEQVSIIADRRKLEEDAKKIIDSAEKSESDGSNASEDLKDEL